MKRFRGAYENVICDEYGYDVVGEEEMVIVGLGHSLGSRLHCIISTDDIVDDNENDDDDENESDDQSDDYEKGGRQRRNTNNNNNKQRRRRNKKPNQNNKLQTIGLKRTANILVSFNNYSALSSVPGVQSLEMGVRETRKQEKEMKDRIYDQQQQQQQQQLRQRQKEQRRRSRSRNYDDDFDNSYRNGGRNRKKRRMYDDDDDDYFNYDDDDDDDDDDLELRDIVTSIKSSLTPDIDKSSLEFRPTPDELWEKITKSYSKNIDKTLVVQFDNDGIDQSSRLAQTILDSTAFSHGNANANANHNANHNDKGGNDNGDMGQKQKQKSKDDLVESKKNNNNDSTSADNNGKESNLEDKGDVEEDEYKILFARLKGTHLNPVSYSDSFGLVEAWKRLSNVPMDDLLKEAIDEDERSFGGRARNSKRKGSSTKVASQKKDNFDDLTDSIARYITDIIQV